MSSTPSPQAPVLPVTDHIAITESLLDVKRLLLLFDKVGLRGLDTMLYVAECGVDFMDIPPCPALHAELSALLSDGVIFQPKEEELWIPTSPTEAFAPDASEDPIVANLATELNSRAFWHFSLIIKEVTLRGQRKGMFQDTPIPQTLDEVEQFLAEHREWSKPLETRLIAARLRTQGINAHPIVELSTPSPPAEGKQAVTEVVLAGLPLLPMEVPLQDLLAFKNDPESRHLLLSLRRWMRSLADQKLSAAEIRDEIEWNLSELRRHLQLHRMRASQGVLKIALKLPLELVENLLRLKLSKTIDAIFAIQELRTSLLAEEISAPGRELAYIVRARNEFSAFDRKGT